MRALTRRDYVRAVLIAFVLVWQAVEAIPIAPPMGPHFLDKPRNQREIGRWKAALDKVGIHRTEKQLVRDADAILAPIRRARSAVLAPAMPFKRYTRVAQRWAVFAAPDEHPQRLKIDVVIEGEVVPWYSRSEREPAPIGALIRQRRARSMIHNKMSLERPAAFCRWVADQVLVAVPEADEVRIYRDFHTVPRPRTGQPKQVSSTQEMCQRTRGEAP